MRGHNFIKMIEEMRLKTPLQMFPPGLQKIIIGYLNDLADDQFFSLLSNEQQSQFIQDFVKGELNRIGLERINALKKLFPSKFPMGWKVSNVSYWDEYNNIDRFIFDPLIRKVMEDYLDTHYFPIGMEEDKPKLLKVLIQMYCADGQNWEKIDRKMQEWIKNPSGHGMAIQFIENGAPIHMAVWTGSENLSPHDLKQDAKLAHTTLLDHIYAKIINVGYYYDAQSYKEILNKILARDSSDYLLQKHIPSTWKFLDAMIAQGDVELIEKVFRACPSLLADKNKKFYQPILAKYYNENRSSFSEIASLFIRHGADLGVELNLDTKLKGRLSLVEYAVTEARFSHRMYQKLFNELLARQGVELELDSVLFHRMQNLNSDQITSIFNKFPDMWMKDTDYRGTLLEEALKQLFNDDLFLRLIKNDENLQKKMVECCIKRMDKLAADDSARAKLENFFAQILEAHPEMKKYAEDFKKHQQKENALKKDTEEKKAQQQQQEALENKEIRAHPQKVVISILKEAVDLLPEFKSALSKPVYQQLDKVKDADVIAILKKLQAEAKKEYQRVMSVYEKNIMPGLLKKAEAKAKTPETKSTLTMFPKQASADAKDPIAKLKNPDAEFLLSLVHIQTRPLLALHFVLLDFKFEKPEDKNAIILKLKKWLETEHLAKAAMELPSKNLSFPGS